MGNLRFNILVRREGEKFYTSDRFNQEDYLTVDELIDHVSHYIRVEVEQELENEIAEGRDRGDDVSQEDN